MTTVIERGWRYLAAWLDDRLAQRTDPRVQVTMAIEEARRRHQLLTEQAAAVIGNQRELEARVERGLAEVERLRTAAARALVIADAAAGRGDRDEADRYESTAVLFASRLAAAEASVSELQEARDRAAAGAAGARQAVAGSAHLLESQMAAARRLLTDIESARMQERVAEALSGLDGLAPAGAVPTLDEVRSRVDRRLALASARTELAGSSASARMLEVERLTVEASGRAKLLEIRAALGLPPPARDGSEGD